MSKSRVCGRLVPATRRPKLRGCPVCGVRRSNVARHMRAHPDWALGRYGGGGYYAFRVVMEINDARLAAPFIRREEDVGRS